MKSNLELIELGSRAREFLSLEVAPSQQGLVATMAESYADALFPPDYGLGVVSPWLRGVTLDGAPAGFIMCADPTATQTDPWIWRLLVDHRVQGLGVGSYALQAAVNRYRTMGCNRLLVSWSPRPSNPSAFYKKLGFVETGEVSDGEVVSALSL